MVVRILLVLGDFLWKQLSNATLAQLFANTWVDLTHLTPLPHTIAFRL